MYCPLCKAEYRAGFTRSCDCDVDLVDAVNTKPADGLSKGNLVLLWAGDDLSLHASILEELKAAGIRYFARPVGAYSRRAFPNRFPAPVAPLFGFEVAVLSSDLKMAKAILRKLGNDT
jgi:hypothetical protein